jgi:ferredoxin-NADP reductase
VKLELLHTKQEASDTFSFVFKPPPLTWQAGQFLKYTLPHDNPDERGEERYFSIASAPHEKNVMLTTRFAAKGSSFKRALRGMKPGETIEADELDGDFVVRDSRKNFIFVAGGIGITPFRAILLDLDRRREPINVILLYANRNDEFPYKQEFENLRIKHPTFRIEYFVHPHRIDENVMRAFQKKLDEPLIYVSGPEPMVEAFDSMLKQMGVPDSDIKNDFFPGYEWPGDERETHVKSAPGASVHS